MRVSTRELNFVKDFLLAIDDAKLSAVSCSTKDPIRINFLSSWREELLKEKSDQSLI